jgi:5-formyltetrahydrofolate cyclo-ligase
VPRWALIYDEQWVDDLPVEGHDAPLDGVVSYSRTAVRRQGAHSGRTSTEGGSA